MYPFLFILVILYPFNTKQEAEDFANKFKEAKLFSLDTTNESPFTLNDIRKYIDFRESVPQVNSSLIQLFIFVL